MNKKRTTILVAFSILVIAATGAVLAAANPSNDEPADDYAAEALATQTKALEAGELNEVAADDHAVTRVINAQGKQIKCDGQYLLVEDRGAHAPLAYVEGHRGDGATMPDAPADSGQLKPTSYAPVCSAEDGQVVWVSGP